MLSSSILFYMYISIISTRCSKQRGSEANKAFNTFYHLTYYDATDVARVRDRNLRRETEHHIADFGHCPTQLFFRPHPSKIQRNPSKTALRTSSTSKTSNIAYNTFFFVTSCLNYTTLLF